MRNFKSADELLSYLVATYSLMSVEGYGEQAKLLEEKAKLTCSTGWEWLGEIASIVHELIRRNDLPSKYIEKLEIVLKTAESKTPYSN